MVPADWAPKMTALKHRKNWKEPISRLAMSVLSEGQQNSEIEHTSMNLPSVPESESSTTEDE